MVRVNATKLRRITSLLQHAVDHEQIPGAVVGVGIGGDVLYQEAVGYAENLGGVTRPMRVDTIFDLASLTKVVACLSGILTFIDEGSLRLGDPVSLFLKEFETSDKKSITIENLLTHTAGLAPSRRFDQVNTTPQSIKQAVRQDTLEYATGTQVVYSDLGFMLLGQIIEMVASQSLDRYVRDSIFKPLGMTNTGYCPSAAAKPYIAATEARDGKPAKVGVVHDENAEALGGVSGHAGLFSNVQDLTRFLQMWLDPHTSVLSPAIRQEAVRCRTRHLSGNRGLGWVCRHDQYDHTGDMWPPTTVGHTGFTGTSVAFDPMSGLWMIVLSNDVHYGREKKAIIRLRHLLHNVVASSIEDFG